MKSNLFLPVFLAFSFASFGQNDSADFYFQKALKEKEAGRKLEVWKNIDKAYQFNAGDKAIVSELANVLLELRKYSQAKEMFKQLEKLGDHSPAVIKQILNLSYNTKQFDDALMYAAKLKKADPSEKVNFFIGKIHYDRDNY
ncbi:MAG TPA: hypothetical protein VI548_03060, partial [Chitinophagaceae bacterium]|nr:hypothetical protein [Chitinophagaceae bacterium]